MDEFSLIKHYFASHATHNSLELDLGIGDDCAIFHLKQDEQMVVTTDTLVSGIHFFANASPYSIGWKSLAVNLSDLAAMGAYPKYFTLALTLPADIQTSNPSFLSEFAKGLFAIAEKYHIDLIGGDTTHGPLSITITAMGSVPYHQAITRSNAKPGDAIYVTGSLGGAALAVKMLYKQQNPPKKCLKHLDFPNPRIAVGIQLRGIATSMLDLSDGLGSDLVHILKLSQCRALIDLDKLPLHEDIKYDHKDLAKEKASDQTIIANSINKALATDNEKLFNPHKTLPLNDLEQFKLALFGGDDYELCFTAPNNEEIQKKIQKISTEQRILITKIGMITDPQDENFKSLCPNSQNTINSSKSEDLSQDASQLSDKTAWILYKLKNEWAVFSNKDQGYNHFN